MVGSNRVVQGKGIVYPLGDAEISKKHWNFFVNNNKATFEDMKKLIEFGKENVKLKTGINIETEIEIIQ